VTIKSLPSNYNLNPKIDSTSTQFCEILRPNNQPWRRDNHEMKLTEQTHTCPQNESQLAPRETQHHICCSFILASLTLLMMTRKNSTTVVLCTRGKTVSKILMITICFLALSLACFSFLYCEKISSRDRVIPKVPRLGGENGQFQHNRASNV
jgi:hypothetical protein